MFHKFGFSCTVLPFSKDSGTFHSLFVGTSVTFVDPKIPPLKQRHWSCQRAANLELLRSGCCLVAFRQPIWNICHRQIGSFLPQGSGIGRAEKFHIFELPPNQWCHCDMSSVFFIFKFLVARDISCFFQSFRCKSRRKKSSTLAGIGRLFLIVYTDEYILLQKIQENRKPWKS